MILILGDNPRRHIPTQDGGMLTVSLAQHSRGEGLSLILNHEFPGRPLHLPDLFKLAAMIRDLAVEEERRRAALEAQDEANEE